MNRLYHLEKTLPRNIEDNLTYSNLEHVILDYNSQDDMKHWVETHLAKYLDTGRLKYFHTPDPVKFNMPHSKNMVCRLAMGNIICLVDADNYTGKNYAEYVNDHFNKTPNTFLTTIAKNKVKNKIDVLGRICFWKNDFLQIKGFDEFMVSYGFDDYDYAYRLEQYGRKRTIINREKFLHAITHTSDERIKNQEVRKDFKCLFIRHINYAESELLYLFNDNLFSMGIMIDNKAKFAANTGNLFKRKAHKYDETLGTEDWLQGHWAIENNTLILQQHNGNRISLNIDNSDGNLFSSTGDIIYYQIEDENIITNLLLFHTVIRNRNRMDRNLKQKKIIVNDLQYGAGKVSDNFYGESFMSI